jgi:hypothetical protein
MEQDVDKWEVSAAAAAADVAEAAGELPQAGLLLLLLASTSVSKLKRAAADAAECGLVSVPPSSRSC